MIEEYLEFSYAIVGFLIYMLFCIGTFRVYSQKKEMTKVFILIFIYIYYSILAIWVIFFININSIFFEKLVYSMIFAGLGGFYLKHYYEKYIKVEDDLLYGQNI